VNDVATQKKGGGILLNPESIDEQELLKRGPSAPLKSMLGGGGKKDSTFQRSLFRGGGELHGGRSPKGER